MNSQKATVRRERRRNMRRSALRTVAILFLVACAARVPEAIVYGMDLCAYCRMQIDDRRFGAVLLSEKGRTFKFDSIECLRRRAAELAAPASSMWVSDYKNPGTMVRADSAVFVNLGPGKTPMAGGWAAVTSKSAAAELGIASADIRQWSELP